MNDEGPNIERLRALGDWMREIGATELSFGSLHIKLGPRQPAPSGKPHVSDPDERSELSEEERALAAKSAEEREHFKYWRRLTRSSGAPIPPFVPKEAKQ